jgi:hypothetical protein
VYPRTPTQPNRGPASVWVSLNFHRPLRLARLKAMLNESIAGMWSYILTTTAVALFPLVLAGYGGHLAAIALPDSPGRRKALMIVWGLAIAGVLLFAATQVTAYRSDKRHEEADKTRDEKEGTFRQSVLRQLQAIGSEPDAAKKKADAASLESSIRAGTPKRTQSAARLAVLNEANDLAEKIDNIGDDYMAQIQAEMHKQSQLAPDIAEHEKPFSDIRENQIRDYEGNRYATLYREKAIAVRAKMLEEIPDIPPYSMPTSEVHWVYESPSNGLGFKEIAQNLRELALAYKRKIEAPAPRP